jgi:hypothetical protein
MNNFGSLEYEYCADRAQHNPDDTSHPHLLAPFSAQEPANDLIASPADGNPRGLTIS